MVLLSWRTYLAVIMLLSIHWLSAQCLISYSWDYSPQPVDGNWGNNETVQVCLTIDEDDWQGGNHYLHGLVPSFGNGWDLSTLQPIAPISCSSDGGYWAWYDGPIISEASGLTHQSGFYYESALGGTDANNPGDNFGDRCPEGLQLEFCFQITTIAFADCDTDIDLNISVNTLSDDESGGAFLSPTCQDDEDALLIAGINCCQANAGADVSLTFCADGPLESINDHLLSNDSGTWYFDNTMTSPLGDSLFYQPGIDPDGTYLFVVEDTLNNCSDIAFVELTSQNGFSAGNDITLTICSQGNIIYLFDEIINDPDLGGTWTDPSGDPWQEPFSPASDLAGVYLYSFPALGSCPAAQAEVTVNLISEADAGVSTDTTLCSCQGIVDLTSLLEGNPQDNGQWLDPDGEVFDGAFDPAIDEAGLYSYSILNANCASSSTLDIIIQTVGNVGESGSYTICQESENIDLFSILAGDFDTGGLWTDPDGIPLTSSIIDPSIAPSGAYTYRFPCLACGNESVLDLTFIPAPSISIDGQISQCQASSFDIIFSSSDPTLLFDIIIEDDQGTQFIFEDLSDNMPLNLSSDQSTTYNIIASSLQDGYIGCSINSSSDAGYTLSTAPVAIVEGMESICPGQSIDIEPSMTGNGPFLIEILNSSSGLSFLSDTINNGDSVTIFPSVDTDYSIVQVWDSSDSVCTSSGQGVFQVEIGTPPSASISGGGLVCGGEYGEAVVNIDGEWDEYDVTIEASFGEYLIEGVMSGQSISFPVPNTLTYCLSSVNPSGSVGCDADLLDTCMAYEVLPALITYSVNVDCDLSTQEGTVSFTIQGGTGNYFVDGEPIVGDQFTSTSMPNGSAFSFSITDDIGCTTNRDGIVECECLYSAAGDFAEASDTLSACIGQSVFPTYNDESEFLDVNDIRSFIIHDGEADIIGNVLLYLDDISSGISYNNLLNTDQVYWLTAIIANELPSGVADPDDVCFSSTTAVGILFHALPTASLDGSSAICAGEQAEFDISLTGNGPWNVQVGLEGSEFGEYVSSEDLFSVLTGSEGSYTILSISDAFCAGTSTGAVEVSVQPLPQASISGGGSFCEGSGNGPTVSLEGTAPWMLTYAVNGEEQALTLGNSPGVIPVFSGGTYSLMSISDANCSNSVSGSAQVTLLPAPSAELTMGDDACEGDSVLTSLAFTEQGPWNFSYSFNSVNSDTIVSNSDFSFYSSESGEFELLHISNTQCDGYNLPSGTVTIHPLPILTASLSEDSLCAGQLVDLDLTTNPGDSIEATLNVNGQLQDIIILSDYISTYSPQEQLDITIGPIIDQATGCTDSTLILLESIVTQYPIVDIGSALDLCSADTVLISTASEPNVNYQWSSSSAYLSTPDSSTTLMSVTNGDPEPLVTEIVLNAELNGCISQASVMTTTDALPQVDFNYNPTPVTAVNPVINLYNLTPGENAYLWTFEGDTISNLNTVSWLFEEDLADEYEVCLEAISLNAGCQNQLCEIIEVVGEMSVFIPNSFSPDADGLNDAFGPVIRNADLEYYSMSIHDRGGSKVFETDRPDEWWNGKEKNVGKRSRNGVYNYIITTRDKFRRSPVVYRGMVTLIR